MTEHTCLQGPLCELMTAFLREQREEMRWCEHRSCLAMLHEACRECEAEGMVAAEEDWRKYQAILPYLKRGLCPVDMTEMKFRAVVAAPGYGNVYGCRCNHSWQYAGGFWYSEEDLRHYVPELTLADVR